MNFTYLRMLLRREGGQTMAEYGVVLSVITASILLVIGALSTGIIGEIANATSKLP
jgi:Flp pilus assembly pilin Flp